MGSSFQSGSRMKMRSRTMIAMSAAMCWIWGTSAMHLLILLLLPSLLLPLLVLLLNLLARAKLLPSVVAKAKPSRNARRQLM